jgi:cell division protein FtsW
MNKLRIDKLYLTSIALLATAGFFIFSSASLGLLARNGASFQSVALNQTIGLILGVVAFYIMSRINHKYLKKYAFYILIGALLVNLMLFVPAFTLSHGGASRWINLGFVTFQPSELLKIAFIIYFAAWLSAIKDKIDTVKFAVIPYMVIMGVIGTLLLAQPDTDTLVVIGTTGLIMLFVAGAKIKHLAIICFIGLCLLSAVVAMRPYAFDRILTFFNGAADTQGSGYQIQQSLIAVGSGEMFGRGFGQSIQKFNYLPEPIGDSIFAVGAEEFGFFGSTILVGLYLLFFIRSVKISTNIDDIFGRLTVVGIAILILIESFMNISSMLGIIPLSGMPLLFVSHGGTALIAALAATGIIANISKYQKIN